MWHAGAEAHGLAHHHTDIHTTSNDRHALIVLSRSGGALPAVHTVLVVRQGGQLCGFGVGACLQVPRLPRPLVANRARRMAARLPSMCSSASALEVPERQRPGCEGKHRVRFACQRGVGLDEVAGRDGQTAAVPGHADGLVATPDRHPRGSSGRRSNEHGAEGDDEPAGTEGIVARTREHPRRPPAHQGKDDLVEVRPERCQLIEDRGRAVISEAALHETVRFELAQPLSKEIRRDPGKPVLQFPVPRWRHEQLTDDEQRPTVTNMVEAPGKPAELTVRSIHHLTISTSLETIKQMDGHSKSSSEIVDVGRDRHFSLFDNGDGETSLLLLHGIPGHRGAWDQVVDRLPAGHRVLVPDLLGFGGSSRPTPGAALHAAAQAEALVALLDRLRIPRVIVVGHDFGGPVALWMTRIRPGLVTHLGLAASNAMPDTPIPFPLNLLKAPILGGIVERATMSPTALRMMIGRGTGRPKVNIDRRAYVGDRRQARATRSIFAMSLRNLHELYTPTMDALHALDIPTFVAWGDRDPFFAVEEGQRVADAVAGASFTVFEGAGHFLPEERPQELADLIAKLTRGRNDP